jgi:hypothetical protein
VKNNLKILHALPEHYANSQLRNVSMLVLIIATRLYNIGTLGVQFVCLLALKLCFKNFNYHI